MEKRITTPLTLEQVKDLKCGDSVLISGVIYTARDAAHKRLCELVAQGKELPFDPKDAVIYYVGPAPAKGDQVDDDGADRADAGAGCRGRAGGVHSAVRA